MTNDIDLKIFYVKNKQKLLQKVIHEMSYLVPILFLDKQNVLLNKKINDFVELESVYNGGQFRMRYLAKETFNLVSLDYKYRLKLNQDEDIILYYTLPILDVVVQKNETIIQKKSKYVNIINGLPVASPVYLKKDIEKIYKEVNDNMKMRFAKSEKDRERFYNLLSYLEKYKDFSSNSTLKRKINEIIDTFRLKKRRIQIESDYESEDESDYESDDSDNKLVVNKGTLEVRFLDSKYEKMLKKVSDVAEIYKARFLNTYNYKKSSKLSFDDIKDINIGDDSEDNLTDLFNKIEI